MLTKHLIKPLILFIFLFLGNFVIAQTAYKVKDIPDPKKNGGGYVSDPDQILGADAVTQINNTIADFELKTNVQVAVVVVNDFEHDKEDFDFAYELFNTWGIGSKTSNNGLLLFISKERRKYRFITGTGTEGVLPDVKLKHIAEQNLIPAFRENDYDTGIINTLNALGEIILKPENKSELNQFFTPKTQKSVGDIWLPAIAILAAFFGVFGLINRQAKKLPKPDPKIKSNYEKPIITGCVFVFFSTIFTIFIIGFSAPKLKLSYIPYILFGVLVISVFFKYMFYISNLRKIHNDDKNYLEAVKAFNQKNWWLVIASPLILFPLIIRLFNRSKNNERFQSILDSRNQEMIRIDRDINIEGKPFLSDGQRKEEVLLTYDYDIWQSVDHKEHIIKQWPAETYNDYLECPECHFRTYKLNKQITTRTATYSHEGQAKIINECSFCKKTEFIRWVTLAMLVESKSSSSSSSSSGSSSSSSSSSWGGGSSSGGGTGGSW
ncbi:TPM domain-containing protein [Pedobacter sp. PF22-3]|uniref:TPM domain-containing protein n=1 Tax=Pedobacter sp. PF22-3 TaxID=2994467 RepID=UPI0022461F99|nr:TPM domain-containing protein [Pedobacter sp. PF22-3]MCX2495455.1 TPM domain-containing protein [Pedobacter sp. PF22-3]